MNLWIIGLVIAGLVVVLGIAVVNAVDSEKTIECSTCGSSCTAQNNCGLASCGAVSGNNGCGCGR